MKDRDRRPRLIYQDRSFLVLEKPAGWIVHRNKIEKTAKPKLTDERYLTDWLIEKWPTIGEATLDLSEKSRLRPGIVHRLDRMTSGLMVVARTKGALKKLSAELKEGRFEKIYTALLCGRPEKPQGAIEGGIERSRKTGYFRLSEKFAGRPSKSLYSVKKTFQAIAKGGKSTTLTLVRCQPITGRTHQLRVHFKAILHPIMGDPIYKTKLSRELSRGLKLGRQFLHASRLSFDHPATGERLTFKSALPFDLERVIKSLNAGHSNQES